MPQVIVCAENAVTRAGLAAMVAATALDVVAQVSSLSELQDWLRTQPADLVLLARSEFTIAASRELVQIVTESPFETNLAILLLTDWDEPPLMGDRSDITNNIWQGCMTPLLATGCISILPLTVSAAQVQGATATILSGFVVIHPDIAEIISTSAATLSIEPDAEIFSPLEPLTSREIEVLNQLAAGLSNRAIASQLKISEHTVKFHISAILAKLDVSSRTEAVAVGIRTRLVML